MATADRIYRLLVVDDDETDRKLYSWLLERQAPGGFVIEQAATGAAGIAALRTRRFDCLLLDFSLPDVTGLEFLTEAAVDGELPCAAVLITGHGNEAVAVEAMKLGVQDYLVKDHVNEGRLWRALVRAVSQAELRQRLAQSLQALTVANANLEREAATRIEAGAALRAAKETAEQADRGKTQFIAMVTHELRTPLNAILGYAELLRMEPGRGTPRDGWIDGIGQAGRQLLGTIERVLDFASIEAGQIVLQSETISLRDTAEYCIAHIAPLASARGLGLRLVRSHDAPARLETDAARLRMVLLSLLHNAVKFTASGGVELRLLAGNAPETSRIEVADTGPGIAPASRGRLFRVFEKMDAATGALGHGLGLGLAIAARVIERMGGTIGFSENPGGGSVFWIVLPAAPVRAEVPPPPRIAPLRLLLVDDIAMNRDVIGAFLRTAGHSVELAPGGEEAVIRASEQVFDLILMDVRMPEMDGMEATRRIRALPAPHGDVPILALTAYNFPDQIQPCRDAGMNGHVVKPVDYATLMRTVADTVARRPSGWTTPEPSIVRDIDTDVRSAPPGQLGLTEAESLPAAR